MEPSSPPRLAIIGSLPPSLRQCLAPSEESRTPVSLRTHLEGITFAADTGLPKPIESTTTAGGTPSVVVEDVHGGRLWRAHIRFSGADTTPSPSSASPGASSEFCLTRPSTTSDGAVGEEILTLPSRGVLQIVANSWREERKPPIQTAVSEAPPAPSDARPPEVMPAPANKRDRTLTSTASAPKTELIVTATTASSPSTAPPPPGRAVETPAPTPSPSTPSALASSQLSAASLLEPTGPHYPLVSLLVHTLARTSPTLAQLIPIVSANQHRFRMVYTPADVQYVLETALCTRAGSRGGGGAHGEMKQTYTLRPDVYVALVEVEDFPRGTPQQEVAATLFRLLDPDDAAQLAKRDALAYLVDRDIVLAAYDAQRERKNTAQSNVGNSDEGGEDGELERAEGTHRGESASAIHMHMPASASSSASTPHTSHGHKRSREADVEKGGGSASPMPTFTSLQQLDVDWDAGDLRLLLPDDALAGVTRTCADLEARLTALALTEDLLEEGAMDTEAAQPVKAKISHHKKKSHKARATRVASDVGAESETNFPAPCVSSSSSCWIQPLPLQTPAAYEDARVLYEVISQRFTSLSTVLLAYETQRTRMESWLRDHDTIHLYSPDVWAAVVEYWQAQARRLAEVQPLVKTLHAMQFLVYRDLRDYVDLTSFGLPLPVTPLPPVNTEHERKVARRRGSEEEA